MAEPDVTTVSISHPKSNSELRTSRRIPEFDAIRVWATGAVIVLHAAYAYCIWPMPGLVWPVPIDQPSPLANAAFWWIEGWVMAVFFLMSGYLAAQTAERGAWKLITSRTQRLLIPLLTIGIVFVFADLVIWCVGFGLTQQATWREVFRMTIPHDIKTHLFGPSHLWYLQYLFRLCLCVAAISAASAMLRKRGISMHLRVADLLSKPIAFGFAPLVAFAGCLAIFHWSPEVYLGFQHDFQPYPPKFLHGTLFFGLGLLLHRCDDPLAALRKGWIVYLSAAAAVFVLLLPVVHETLAGDRLATTDHLRTLLLAAFATTATFGHLGLFSLGNFGKSERCRFLARASYWTYLLHHGLVGAVATALYFVPIAATLKFFIAVPLVGATCLVTYRHFVMGRWIERLLDGKLFVRPKSDSARAPVNAPGPAEAA
ncbi:acyltransferase family protein [Stratiformator vulcanicus]|uniref:Glucans biosynthesis protein n=1 Tax=Stratiformator vulcanicus TaxID=2527980 RepID=A0A517R0X8_9PLAN|nr:acyltransferase family protein [Stratiformator vulcanicus]QDT37490.1 glucans biosynthesis protein [Stratiformator vulcanicus]